MQSEDLRCFICDKQLSDKRRLIGHLKTEMKKNPEYNGQIETLLTQLQPKRYDFSHSAEDKNTCDYCRRVLKNKYSKKRHESNCEKRHLNAPTINQDVINASNSLLQPTMAEIISDSEGDDDTNSDHGSSASKVDKEFLGHALGTDRQPIALNSKTIAKNPLEFLKVSSDHQPSDNDDAIPVFQAAPTIQINQQQKVRLVLEKDDYLKVLTEVMGSRESAIAFVRSSFYKGVEGDLDIFEKVYLDGLRPDQYPLKCLDYQKGVFCYLQEDGQYKVDNKITETIVDHVQNCYISVQSDTIDKHLEKDSTTATQTFLFEIHDLKQWQDGIFGKSSHKYKNKFVKGLIRRLKLRIEQAQGPTDLVIS